MNNALIDIQQAASARFCGKKAFVRALVIGCAVTFASASASAGQDQRDRDRDAQRNAPPAAQQVREQPRQEHTAPQPQPRQFDPRQFDSRMYDARAEEQRRQSQQQQQDQGARRGRLTPDERRELRRQINEAGTDLYPNTPRR